MAMTAIKRSLYRKLLVTRGLYTISRMLQWDLRGPADYSGYCYSLNHFFTKAPRKSTSWRIDFDALENAMFLQAKEPLMAVIATTRAPAPSLNIFKVSVVVAGDAYLGDPQLALMVNGQQVGTATVTASHSSGQWQTLTFSVLMPASMQTIGISFLNHAYGGAPPPPPEL